jgi:hypothetical protein
MACIGDTGVRSPPIAVSQRNDLSPAASKCLLIERCVKRFAK